MPEIQQRRPLSSREREILRDVINTFVLTGEPVSSRAVSKIERHGLSAASIRNIMADLEDWGYLAQPHTSAGRVPTPSGYHLFIEALKDSRALPARERRYVDENLKAGTTDPERAVEVASRLLSELSDQVGIVLAPALGDTVLREVDFISLPGNRVLCIVVSSGGFVDSKPVEVDKPLSREELLRISNYLTENFAGLTLRQARDRLLGMMAEERSQVDGLLSLAITLAGKGLAGNDGRELRVDGTASLLQRPEIGSLDRVRRLLDTFADKARLVEILNRCMDGGGMRVLIGEDSALTSELDFSLVATSYGSADRVLGSLGIFGPSRMEYARIIPIVHYLGETLGGVLGQGAAGEPDAPR